MKQWVYVLFFIFLNLAKAQENNTFDALVQSYTDMVYTNTEKALTYAMQAKSVAVVANNSKQLAQADYFIANCKNILHKNKEALTHIEAAITNTKTSEEVLFIYKCQTLKGNILLELGRDSEALKQYIKAKTYAVQLQNPLYEIAPLLNIAFIKKTHKDFEEATDLFKNILQLINTTEETNDTKYYKLLALMNIADTYLWLQNPEEAALYNNAGLQICSETQDGWAYYIFLMNKAIIQYQNKEYKVCIENIKQVEVYAKENNEKLYFTALFYKGKHAYQVQAYKKCIQYLEKVYTLLKVSDDVDVNEKELHEFLALAYHKVDNSDKALYHFQQYTTIEKKQSTEDIKLNNETHELVDVIPLKTKIDTLGEQLIQESNNKKGFIGASIGLLLILISSLFYYRIRTKQNQKKFENLLQKVSALEAEKQQKIETQKETVPNEKVQAILKKLDKFEKKESYLSKECSLGMLAEEMETNTAYLSKVINTYKEKSFTAYITTLRIETVLLQLKNNKTLQSYTIMAIADEFGFKRQETFSRAFKAYTGIYPSQYIKNLKERG